MSDFGQQLRRVRESRKLTKQKAATVMGVSLGALDKWERGLREPRPLSLPELTRRLEKLRKFSQAA